MPWNGSGDFSLSDTIAPATNADANELQAILTDIGTGIDASINADGQSTITGALKGSDGTAALPAYSFSADLNSGFYRIGSDNVGLSLGGTKRIDFGTAGTVITGTFGVSSDFAVATNKFTVAGASGNTVVAGTLGVTGATTHTGAVTLSAAIDGANGTVNLPQYAFTNDLDCGLYRIGANNIGIAVNAAKVLDIATTGLTVTGLLTSTAKTTPSTQRLTSGTGATFTPTAGAILWRVRMLGPGSGGGAAITNNGSVSAGDTSFQVNSTGTAWTAAKSATGGASGSTNGNGGVGGSGGTDGSTGTLVFRLPGNGGGGGALQGTTGIGGVGGAGPFGGAGRALGQSAGVAATTNSGAGGGGAGDAASHAAGGGGAGEYVEFWVTGMTTATYTIPAGGAGGTAGTNAGGNGGSGVIIVEEFYS